MTGKMTNANKNDEIFGDIDALLEGHFYKLVDKKPVPCSFAEYATGMKSADNRIIEQTAVGDLTVSTVFTGIDHAFGMGQKQLFETTVFGLPDDIQPQWRFATWEDAVNQHLQLVVMLEHDGPDSLLEEIRKKQAD